jgi:hypothetical protein
MEGIDVGQCTCRMVDMLEDLLFKISASTQHRGQDLELHRYPMGDTEQHDWNTHDRDPQECIQMITNNTMGHSIGRTDSVADVVTQRDGAAKGDSK